MSEEAIRKLAAKIMQRDGVSEKTAFRRAQRWADTVNARAYGPPAPAKPLCPGPRCQCPDCTHAHQRMLRGQYPSSSSALMGGW